MRTPADFFNFLLRPTHSLSPSSLVVLAPPPNSPPLSSPLTLPAFEESLRTAGTPRPSSEERVSEMAALLSALPNPLSWATTTASFASEGPETKAATATPLTLAAALGDVPAVLLLLSLGFLSHDASIISASSTGMTAALRSILLSPSYSPSPSTPSFLFTSACRQLTSPPLLLHLLTDSSSARSLRKLCTVPEFPDEARGRTVVEEGLGRAAVAFAAMDVENAK